MFFDNRFKSGGKSLEADLVSVLGILRRGPLERDVEKSSSGMGERVLAKHSPESWGEGTQG